MSSQCRAEKKEAVRERTKVERVNEYFSLWIRFSFQVFNNVSLSDSPKHLKSFSAFIRHFHPDCVQILVYFNTVHKLTH